MGPAGSNSICSSSDVGTGYAMAADNSSLSEVINALADMWASSYTGLTIDLWTPDGSCIDHDHARYSVRHYGN